MERTAEIEHGLMEGLAPLMANRESAEVVAPGHRPLDHPAIPAQTHLLLHPLARDADAAAAPRQEAPPDARRLPVAPPLPPAGATAAAGELQQQVIPRSTFGCRNCPE